MIRAITTDAIAALIDTLQAAQNGLQWYRDNHPKADSQADDEMHAQIGRCIATLSTAAAGEPAEVAAEDDRYHRPALVLSGYQLQAALGFIAPDSTAEQLEQTVCLAERDNVGDEDGGSPPLPAGLFVWLEDYPEEGLMPLDGKPSIGTAALLASTTTPADIASEGLVTCNCRWRGEDQVQQCSLHHSHIDAIHEWAGRAKNAEAKLLTAIAGRDHLFGALRQALIKLPRYSFLLLNGGVQRAHDPSGRWVELDEATALVEPERVDVMVAQLKLQYSKALGTAAAVDVLNERIRQINAEGWTPAHDDEHDPGELAAAAAAYALAAADLQHPMSLGDGDFGLGKPPIIWPWSHEWWKPADARRNLVKAGALTQAAIEQIDRTKASPESTRT